jgi:carbon-monoxide dehydrogenase medium subunit
MAAAAPLIADPIVRNRGTLVGSLCHADPQGDWASVVLALGGSVVARGSGGTRTIPLADFVTGPFQNVLETGRDRGRSRDPRRAGRQVRRLPQAGAPGRRLRHGRGRGGAGDQRREGDQGGHRADRGRRVTIGATEAAQALTGQPLTAETIEQAAELAAQAARPRTDHRGSADYKRHMVRTFVLRLLSRGETAETAERAA